RAAALMEVFGVYVAGGVVTNQLVRLFGVSFRNPLENLTVDISGTELIRASGHLFVLLLFQYAGYFLLIIPINWWYRRRGPADYGLTKAGHSWAILLTAGIGTAALSEWLVLGVGLVNAIHPSETVPWRQAFFEMSWRRWEFWLFSSVMSWALIPVLEELFFRGYCQRRLAEDWGDGPAIIATACLFTFAHAQYQIPNVYNAGMILGLLLSAIGFGVVFAWTRSLIPAMLAHAVFDIPTTPRSQSLLVAALVVGALFSWRQAVAIIGQVFRNGSGVTHSILAVFSAGYAVAAARVRSLEYLAIGLLVFAVAFEALDRRQNGIPTARLP
ncbi:MAG: CPBP family intramembrane metalloprotease, partial [Acidobacteriaceae bacterium]|nr:CPBP family intramembrane metalloprotease [Acidobacteriaceae bacterium]